MKNVLKIAGGVVVGAVALLGVVYLIGKHEKKEESNSSSSHILVLNDETK